MSLLSYIVGYIDETGQPQMAQYTAGSRRLLLESMVENFSRMEIADGTPVVVAARDQALAVVARYRYRAPRIGRFEEYDE